MTSPAGPGPTDRLVTRAFSIAWLAHLLHSLAFNLFIHLPGFLVSLGAEEVEIGLLFGATAATAVATRPALGHALDTRGRRAVILAGGVLHAVASALYLGVHSLGPWLYAVRLTHGVAEAMLFAALFAYAADIVPASRRIEGVALFGVSGMIPMAIGGLLGDAILARGTYRHLFATATALAIVALALSLALRDAPRAPGGEAPRGVVSAFLTRELLPLWFIGLAISTALASNFTFLKTFVLATRVGSVGWFFAAYAGAAVVLRIGFGRVPERVGPKRAFFAATIAMALGLALLARASTSSAVTAAGALCGLGHGYTFPILLGLVVGRARASERGAALAIFTALWDGGTLVGGPLLGAIIHARGYAAMYAFTAGLVAVGAAAFAVIDRRRT